MYQLLNICLNEVIVQFGWGLLARLPDCRAYSSTTDAVLAVAALAHVQEAVAVHVAAALVAMICYLPRLCVGAGIWVRDDRAVVPFFCHSDFGSFRPVGTSVWFSSGGTDCPTLH